MNIKFKKPSKKILEAIIWIANQQPGIDHYHIVKILFGADKKHLNKYGRPITGDDYKAMIFGPVPSLAYDFLKENEMNLSEKDLSALEESIEFQTEGRIKKIYPKRKFDLTCFSRTDLECLKEAYDLCHSLSFQELKTLTHKEEAWETARNSDKMSNSPEMNYELFIDNKNPNRDEIIDHLREVCHGIVL